MTNEGGTVRYHRAEWQPEDERWKLHFVKRANAQVFFSREQGEAMGLTPPEPAPLVIECNGHSIELSDDTSRIFIDYWSTCEPVTRYKHAACALAGLLRDARQDPKPASDEPNTHVLIGSGPHVRPITPKPQPGQDDTPGIDFDALPIGAEMEHVNGEVAVRRHEGWWNVTGGCWCDPRTAADWSVVYQPASLSPGECLRGLLAGRDDADELIEYAQHIHTVDGDSLGIRWWSVIGNAAREVHG